MDPCHGWFALLAPPSGDWLAAFSFARRRWSGLVCGLVRACVMQRLDSPGSTDYEYRPGGSAYNGGTPE
jgi:hypothetical protein